MIVVCPHCSTRFNLPERQIKPDAKLRCSVCKHVFAIPPTLSFDRQDSDTNQDFSAEAPPSGASDSLGLHLGFEADGPPSKPEGKKRGIFLPILLILVLLLGGGGFVAWKFFPELLQPIMQYIGETTPSEQQSDESIAKIELRNVRQYIINNEKLGPLTVIQGKAVNGFTEPRELIRVEAALYDKGGNPLIAKEVLTGTTATLFQLRVLDQEELENILNNKIDVLTYNTNVQPSGEVPFMVVFYNPPDEAYEFGVKVTAAQPVTNN